MISFSLGAIETSYLVQSQSYRSHIPKRISCTGHQWHTAVITIAVILITYSQKDFMHRSSMAYRVPGSGEVINGIQKMAGKIFNIRRLITHHRQCLQPVCTMMADNNSRIKRALIICDIQTDILPSLFANSPSQREAFLILTRRPICRTRRHLLSVAY